MTRPTQSKYLEKRRKLCASPVEFIDAYEKEVKAKVAMGDLNEKINKPILEYYFDTKLNFTKTYAIFDYINPDKTIFIELKSRKTAKNDYEDTMIGYNKIKAAKRLLKVKDKDIKIYLVFSFSDCLCYYEFKKVNKKYKRKFGTTVRKDYYYIPTSELTDIIVKKHRYGISVIPEDLSEFAACNN